MAEEFFTRFLEQERTRIHVNSNRITIPAFFDFDRAWEEIRKRNHPQTIT